jgi:L-ascorbate metabolism protein UlaG (beta-lactamase superfamily)
VGLKDVTTKDSIELATEARLAVQSPDALLNIEGPGEYEVADFSIRGVAVERHIDTEAQPKMGTMYRIEVGDIRIAVLGNMRDNLSDDQLEELGVIDMVVLPVGGGGYTLDGFQAAKLIRKIDAKVVVPIHYAENGIKYEVPQDDLSAFKKEFVADVQETPKLKIKSASSLPLVATIYEIARS